MKRLNLVMSMAFAMFILVLTIGPPTVEASVTKSAVMEISPNTTTPLVALGGATVDTNWADEWNHAPSSILAKSTTNTDSNHGADQKALNSTTKKRVARASRRRANGKQQLEGRHRMRAVRQTTQSETTRQMANSPDSVTATRE